MIDIVSIIKEYIKQLGFYARVWNKSKFGAEIDIRPPEPVQVVMSEYVFITLRIRNGQIEILRYGYTTDWGIVRTVDIADPLMFDALDDEIRYALINFNKFWGRTVI